MKHLPQLGGALLLCCALFANSPFANAADQPDKGQTMAQVEAAFGAPKEKLEPVGQPPITRWLYDGYTVYFEHDHVIFSVQVQHRAPPKPAPAIAPTVTIPAPAAPDAAPADQPAAPAPQPVPAPTQAPAQLQGDSPEDHLDFKPIPSLQPRRIPGAGDSDSSSDSAVVPSASTSVPNNVITKTIPLTPDAVKQPTPAVSPVTAAPIAPAIPASSPAPAVPQPAAPVAAPAPKPVTAPAPAPAAKPAAPATTLAAPPATSSPSAPAPTTSNAAPAASTANTAAAKAAAAKGAVDDALQAVTQREQAPAAPTPPPAQQDLVSSDGLIHKGAYSFDPVTGRIIVNKSEQAAASAASAP